MKDGLPVSFFQNTSDLTALQHEFLMWVKVYSFLLELIQEKHPLLNEKILEHDLWVDAFLLWREKHPDVKPEDLKRRKGVVICR